VYHIRDLRRTFSVFVIIKLTCLEVSEFPCLTDHVCFLDFECFDRGCSLGLAVGGYTFGTVEFSFISTLNMAALSHQKPESAGMFHDRCDDQDSNKRNKLLASVPLFSGIYSNDMSLKQNCVFS
jgi:hypothetical protein